MASQLTLHKLEPEPQPKPARDVVTRWGGDPRIKKEGFVPIPKRFLDYHAALKPYSITVAEALFIIHLMWYKWDEKPPYPSLKTLARRMGVTAIYARRIARSLEGKGLLKRLPRSGYTNAFDVTPLFKKLAAHVTAEAQQGTKKPTRKRAKPGR
jgi:DNA-binding MarR family transcriptional regulator